MNSCKLIAFLAILPLMGCEHTTSEILHTSHELETSSVQIGEQSWTVEIAKTPEQRQQGLMLREKLEVGKGMFFEFEEEDFHAFWMKNTFIPLDVIWISKDKKVIEMQTLQPCTTDQCESFKPSQKAQFVLEVNAGAFEGGRGNELFLSSE